MLPFRLRLVTPACPVPWLVVAVPERAVAIAFGPFVLDTDQRQLVDGGRAVHLSRKAFDLLTLLVQERPRVIPKTELHEKLWPDTFVSDATLASLVAEVRDALHEHAHDSHFIRTVHGFGYAFAAEATQFAPYGSTTQPAALYWITWADQRRDLHEGEYVLGRDHDATIALESLSVSRRHARLAIRPKTATIEDLGSRNGTYVGDVLVTAPAVLNDGDMFRLGSVILTFRSMIAPRSTGPLEEQLQPPESPDSWRD